MPYQTPFGYNAINPNTQSTTSTQAFSASAARAAGYNVVADPNAPAGYILFAKGNPQPLTVTGTGDTASSSAAHPAQSNNAQPSHQNNNNNNAQASAQNNTASQTNTSSPGATTSTQAFSATAARAAGYNVVADPNAPGGYILFAKGNPQPLTVTGTPYTASSSAAKAYLAAAEQGKTLSQNTPSVDYQTFGVNAGLLNPSGGIYTASSPNPQNGNYVDPHTGAYRITETIDGKEYTFKGNVPITRDIWDTAVDMAWNEYLSTLPQAQQIVAQSSSTSLGTGSSSTGGTVISTTQTPKITINSDTGQVTVTGTPKSTITSFTPGYYLINGKAEYVSNEAYLQNAINNSQSIAYLGSLTSIDPNLVSFLNSGKNAEIVFNTAAPTLSASSSTTPAQTTPAQAVEMANYAAQLGSAGAQLSPMTNETLLTNLVNSGLTPAEAASFIQSLTPDQLSHLKNGESYTLYTKSDTGQINVSYAPTSESYSTWQNALNNYENSPYAQYIAPALGDISAIPETAGALGTAGTALNADIVKPAEQFAYNLH